MKLGRALVGAEPFADGTLEHIMWDEAADLYALSFSTATSPSQVYTIEGKTRSSIYVHTKERILGIAEGLLATGEDASFLSHDGLRVSARLYLPAKALGWVLDPWSITSTAGHRARKSRIFPGSRCPSSNS